MHLLVLPALARRAASVTHQLRGALALDDMAEFIGRYVVFPSEHCLPTVVLWAAHTWAVESFYVTPRLVLDSAEPGSGKTRVLELLNLFTQNPEMILSPTTAAIFRMLAEKPYSLLFDEVDAVFDKRNGAGNYEDLRGLLNAGYKRGATIPRCVGDAAKMKVHRFKVFAPVALAGIAGNMPATITTRAVTIHMRKRARNEKVEPYEEEDAEQAAEPLRAALTGWLADVALAGSRPALPGGVVDRNAELWRPLVAVADAAGGDWPERARAACRHFVLDVDAEPPSLGVRLLADLRDLYRRRDTDRLATIEIIKELTALDEAPWSDMWGKPLDPRRLSKELDRYGVHSGSLRIGGTVVKGYQSTGEKGLADAWARYLPPEPVTPVTHATSQVRGVTGPAGVTDAAVTPTLPVTADEPLTWADTDATAVTAGSGSGDRCDSCQHLLAPEIRAAGMSRHPSCPDPDEPAS